MPTGHYPRNPGPSPIMREVEEEFGEPFVEVLKGFAADGYGCDTTARIIGYESPGAFRNLLKRRKILIDWPPMSEQVIFKELPPRPQAVKDKIRRIKREQADKITHPNTGESLCLAEWCERLQISLAALWARIHGRKGRPKWDLAKALSTPPDRSRCSQTLTNRE